MIHQRAPRICLMYAKALLPFSLQFFRFSWIFFCLLISYLQLTLFFHLIYYFIFAPFAEQQFEAAIE